MTDKTPPKDLLDWLGITNAPNWTRSRWIGGATSVFVALLIGGAYSAAFWLIYGVLFWGKEAGFGTGTVIVALLGAPFLVWSTVIKQKTVEFQKESHITERISKAVEQLGEEKTVKEIVDGETVERTVPNIEVRIGGLLSLERIAQDSTNYDKGRDHVRVMEILCAYVRENAPASDAKISWRERWEDARDGKGPNDPPMSESEFLEHVIGDPAGRLDDYVGIQASKHWARNLPKPRADIALALQIIGRRTPEQRRVEARWGPDADPDAAWVFHHSFPDHPKLLAGQEYDGQYFIGFKHEVRKWNKELENYQGYRLDLRATNLQRATLSKLNLSGAHLDHSRLDGAVLGDAQLVGADLSYAHMPHAYCQRTRFAGANLTATRLQGADLRSAQAQSALLFLTRLEKTELMGSRLDGARVTSSNLVSCNLAFAVLACASFVKCRLPSSDLTESRCDGTEFREILLDARTSFVRASIRCASLKDFDFSFLPPALLTADQINTAFGDASVVRPANIERPSHWPDWKLPWAQQPSFSQEYQEWLSSPTTYTPPKKPTA